MGDTGKHPHLLDHCRKRALERPGDPQETGVPEAKQGEVHHWARVGGSEGRADGGQTGGDVGAWRRHLQEAFVGRKDKGMRPERSKEVAKI